VSQENVQLVKEAADAYNRGEVEAMLEYYDPNIEWVTPSGAIDDYVYKGHAGVKKLLSLWTEQFDNFHVDVARVLDLADDQVLVLGYQRGHIKGSDHELEQQMAYDGEVRDGKVTRVRVYLSWEDALKAVGLEE
jgi:ketosteroid isomerase-like protein